MAQVRVIDPCVDQRWDQFVEDHPFGWLTHLSGWKEVMARSFQHVKPHYLALFDGDRIVAGLPLFEVRSWLTGNKLVSIPFATLCDALVSDPQQFRILLEASLVLMKKSRASFFELRTLASADMIKDERLGVQRYFQHHFLRLNGDPELLKKSFHRTCVRQKIQRARLCGLQSLHGAGHREQAGRDRHRCRRGREEGVSAAADGPRAEIPHPARRREPLQLCRRAAGAHVGRRRPVRHAAVPQVTAVRRGGRPAAPDRAPSEWPGPRGALPSPARARRRPPSYSSPWSRPRATPSRSPCNRTPSGRRTT